MLQAACTHTHRLPALTVHPAPTGTLALLILLQLWASPVDVSQLWVRLEPCGAHSLHSSGVLVREITNASNHLYPYVATIITCGCILVVIIGIIMFGGDL